jgi:hypothetical protein
MIVRAERTHRVIPIRRWRLSPLAGCQSYPAAKNPSATESFKKPYVIRALLSYNERKRRFFGMFPTQHTLSDEPSAVASPTGARRALGRWPPSALPTRSASFDVAHPFPATNRAEQISPKQDAMGYHGKRPGYVGVDQETPSHEGAKHLIRSPRAPERLRQRRQGGDDGVSRWGFGAMNERRGVDARRKAHRALNDSLYTICARFGKMAEQSRQKQVINLIWKRTNAFFLRNAFQFQLNAPVAASWRRPGRRQ